MKALPPDEILQQSGGKKKKSLAGGGDEAREGREGVKGETARQGRGWGKIGLMGRQIGKRVMKWKRVIIGQRQKYCR